MEEPHYDEFDVLLEPTSAGGYTARVLDSPTGPTKPVPFLPPGTPEGLKLLVLTLRAVHGVRALEAEAVPDAKKYGTSLFDAIFHDEALSALRGSLHVAAVNRHGLRLRLRFNDTPALVNIPWELMYDKEAHRFPCQLGKYPVIRFVEIAEPLSPLAVTGPVRMIVVISSPSDYQQLNVEAEWSKLQGILEPLVKSGRLQVDRLPTASLDVLRRAVLNDYHVFHFIGHGGVDKATGDGILIFTGPDGQGRRVTGHDLGVMLSNSPIRLAVLNSCEGARISEVDPYAGTAVSLVQQGIPAVVAMQFEITDEAAIAFSSTLYEGITMGRPVDLAVTLARQAILAVRPTEWATPVLYLRAGDGKIFDLADQVIEAPPHPARPPQPAPVAILQPAPEAGPEPKPEPKPPPAPETAPLPPPQPPMSPTRLAGRAKGRQVMLVWAQPQVEDSPVDHWEVLRDGAVVARTGSNHWVDTPGRGRFAYAVTAVGRDGRRSPPSSDVVLGPRRRRWTWVVGLAALAAVALLVWKLWPPPPPPAILKAPTNLTGTMEQAPGTTTARVTLSWDPAPADSATVSSWEVLRNGVIVGGSTVPNADDTLTKAWKYTYRVRAVGMDGKRSPLSNAWATTVTKPAHVPRPDMTIRVFDHGAAGGSGEVLVTFQTDNRDTEDIAKGEQVAVEVSGTGEILDASYYWGTDSANTVQCERRGTTGAVCAVGDHPTHGVVKVAVTVMGTETFDVTATVSTQTDDANPSNDRATYRVTVPTTPTTTPPSPTPSPTS